MDFEPSIKFGEMLAHPEPGEEVVISGMSGLFPFSEDIEEFHENMRNKVEMITEIRKSKIPGTVGKIRDTSRFDVGFFDVLKRTSLTMGPVLKILLEKSIECIFDAGINPSDLEGTNTGVMLGLCVSENDLYEPLSEMTRGPYSILNKLKSNAAHKISHYLKLRGPSMVMDTACSSSAYALEAAYKSIRMGQCEAAIVGSANIILGSSWLPKFERFGVLSRDGHCRPFDKDGTGYVRTEAVVVIFLQKSKHCNRIYATVIHTKINCDGYTEQGITYPSADEQYKLLKEMYTESGIIPHDIKYIEAHATGTIVGDPVESNCIDEFFARGRKTPLLIGSVKSNVGHSEPVSGLCSLIKVLLAFETNVITANINYKTPRDTIPGISEGRLQVVTDNASIDIDLAGVNNFGFGGTNAHIILKQHIKTKVGDRAPIDNLPRLVCISGRTEESVNILLEDVNQKFNAEYIALIQNIFRKNIKNHLYRGYAVISKQGLLKKSIKLSSSISCPSHVHIYFGGISNIEGNLALTLLDLPILTSFKNRIQNFFMENGNELDTILSNTECSKPYQVVVEFLTVLALIELLKQLEIKTMFSLQHFFGKYISAYLESILNLEQILECINALSKTEERIIEEDTNSIINGCIKNNIAPSQTIQGYNDLTKYCEHNKYVFSKSCIILEIGSDFNYCRAERHYLNLNSSSDILEILEVIGSLYEKGLQPQIQNIYPKVDFPVSRGTPLISSKIRWKHDLKNSSPSFDNCDILEAGVFKINLKDPEWAPLAGHVIDGMHRFPPMGYIYLVWSTFAKIMSRDLSTLQVVFEKCKFNSSCSSVLSSTSLDLIIIIKKNGEFVTYEGDVVRVSGKIRTIDEEKNMPYIASILKKVQKIDTLQTEDFYKELRLRGYNYTGAFKSVINFNVSTACGTIYWLENWIAFMDNMLQLKIFSDNSRLLCVPISIDYLMINPQHHLNQVKKLREEDKNNLTTIPVNISHQCGAIRSEGIEIRGLVTTSMPRKQKPELPILEKHQFVPNETNLLLEEAMRVFMQRVLETNYKQKVKIIEFIDESNKNNYHDLSTTVRNIFEDTPLVSSDIIIFCTETLNLDIKIANKSLKYADDCDVVIGSRLLAREAVLQDAINASVECGYIISREPLVSKVSEIKRDDLVVYNIANTRQEKIVLLRKQPSIASRKSAIFINLTESETFDWLEELKNSIGKKDQDVICWCQNIPVSGILGLVNCIRTEPGCQHVRSLFIADEAPDFDPNISFYKNQLDKNMAVNVYMHGQWGTYKHLLLDKTTRAECEHYYANSTVQGDLSNIKWIEGSLSRNVKTTQVNEQLIEVFYSSLNLDDVIVASGKISVDVITRNRLKQQCVCGFEFSGKTLCGRRVMGIQFHGSMATLVKADEALLWDVPEMWTLRDASTVPVIYTTCLYALIIIGKIKPHDSILIHLGAGDIGQAAINICLHLGCRVFTTVSNSEEREYIKKEFPVITGKHIGNSRNPSFEQMIMKETQGIGVDIVLNQLEEKMLLPSIRCLAKNGRFLEIGKYDLANNNQLKLSAVTDSWSYHGVMLDKICSHDVAGKQVLKDLVQKYINAGVIKPLKSIVFKKHEVDQAFRTMTAGRPIGKILIQIRPEDNNNNNEAPLEILPRFYCDPSKSYIICGGLGGIGLELADWLVLRGAKNLVLTSRKGISTGYQNYRISIWKSYSCKVNVFIGNITTESVCQELIMEANTLAPVGAIFNLAVVLEDAIFENQSQKSFEASFVPKAWATQHLDNVSRRMCPELRNFVVFSSVTCGRGNPGQSNYGMANSVMERICEKRREEGYPALAIQWATIGDVGITIEIQGDTTLEVRGTSQQSISSCLQVLDVLLTQTEAAVVSSMVVAEKKMSSVFENIIDAVGDILGIRDIRSVSMHSTLAELGMDSVTGMEIKHTFERQYNLFLTHQDIRSLTLKRVEELQNNISSQVETLDKRIRDRLDLPGIFKAMMNTKGPKSKVVQLKTRTNVLKGAETPKIIVIPGIEGICDTMQNVTKQLEVEAYGLNYDFCQEESIPKLADTLISHIEDLLEPNKPFHIIAYPFGSCIALEVVSKLEKLGYEGTITMLDDSPALTKELIVTLKGNKIGQLENHLISSLLKIYLSDEETEIMMDKVRKCSSWNKKIDLLMTNMKINEQLPNQFISDIATAVLKQMNACCLHEPNAANLKAKCKLYKSTCENIILDSEDYNLGQYFEKDVEVMVFECTHTNLLSNGEVTKALMNDISKVQP